MQFRTLELYPHGYPATPEQMIGEPDAVTHLSEVFRKCMLKEEGFRSTGIRVGDSMPVFAHFQRVGHTAGFGTWARYQSNDVVETIRRGLDAFTLLLSGVSKEADNQVVQMFRELVTTPVLTTPEFTTQDYGIDPGFVEQVQAQNGPVGLNIYIRPNVVEETAITSAAAAMASAFFKLLGAEYSGE